MIPTQRNKEIKSPKKAPFTKEGFMLTIFKLFTMSVYKIRNRDMSAGYIKFI